MIWSSLDAKFAAKVLQNIEHIDVTADKTMFAIRTTLDRRAYNRQNNPTFGWRHVAVLTGRVRSIIGIQPFAVRRLFRKKVFAEHTFFSDIVGVQIVAGGAQFRLKEMRALLGYKPGAPRHHVYACPMGYEGAE
jgi:hypothetical protein